MRWAAGSQQARWLGRLAEHAHGLAVCEDRAVVALQYGLKDGDSHLAVDGLLVRIRPVHSVECPCAPRLVLAGHRAIGRD